MKQAKENTDLEFQVVGKRILLSKEGVMMSLNYEEAKALGGFLCNANDVLRDMRWEHKDDE